MSGEMRCAQADELAAAYVLGALPADERDAVARHLATCDEPHVALRELLGSEAAVAMSIEPVAPPAALRDRLMATVARTAQDHRPSTARDARRGWLDWLSPRLARPLAVAAMAGLIAVGGWSLALQSQLGERDRSLRAVADALAAGGAAFRVDGSAGRGYVVDTPGSGAAFVVADLASLPGDRLYELWLLDASGAAVAVGTYVPSDGDVAVIPVDRDLGGFAAFAVTVEAERVAAPSGTPVMVGELRAT